MQLESSRADVMLFKIHGTDSRLTWTLIWEEQQQIESVVDEVDFVTVTSGSLTVVKPVTLQFCLENHALSPCSPAVLDIDTLYLFMLYPQSVTGYRDHFTLKKGFFKAIHLTQTRISKHSIILCSSFTEFLNTEIS